MKNYAFIRILLLIVLAMSAAIALQASPYDQQAPLLDDDASTDNQEHTSLGRFLRQRYRGPMTCNKYPKICRAKGSPGRDCCKNKCVNVKTDRLNCGLCGKKCKYSEVCCKGKCVKPMYDKNHCGGCNNKCNKGSACVYGMCSYA